MPRGSFPSAAIRRTILVLSDSMVSRRHAILEQRDDIFVLRDNNSSNGTLVNGDKVEAEKTLRDGDLVAIGSSRLLFQLDDGAAVPEALASAAAAPESAGTPPARSKTVAIRARPLPRPSAKPASINCPSCGKKSLTSDRFCRACGNELEKKTSVPCAPRAARSCRCPRSSVATAATSYPRKTASVPRSRRNLTGAPSFSARR